MDYGNLSESWGSSLTRDEKGLDWTPLLLSWLKVDVPEAYDRIF